MYLYLSELIAGSMLYIKVHKAMQKEAIKMMNLAGFYI